MSNPPASSNVQVLMESNKKNNNKEMSMSKVAIDVIMQKENEIKKTAQKLEKLKKKKESLKQKQENEEK